MDIELKMYDSSQASYSSRDKDIPLQLTKFGNNFYTPYFTLVNGEMKLYNVWDIKNKQWINDTFNKDLYVLYYLRDGLFTLKLNDEKSFKVNKPFLEVPKYKNPIKDINQLYVFNIDDIHKNMYKKVDEIKIDNNKLERFII